MTAAAGAVFLSSIVPIIQAVIARGAVKLVGSEDAEELIADCAAQAAAILDSAERSGKAVNPNSVAHYAIQSVKSGRRFGYAGRLDAMSSAAALDGAVQVCSFDAPVANSEDDHGDFTLHDVLSGSGEDVDQAAARRIDWGELEKRLDERRSLVLRDTAAGIGPSETAAKLSVSAPYVVSLKRDCAKVVRESWGENAIYECTAPTVWRRGLRACRRSS